MCGLSTSFSQRICLLSSDFRIFDNDANCIYDKFFCVTSATASCYRYSASCAGTSRRCVETKDCT